MDLIPHKLGIGIHIEPGQPLELSQLLLNLNSFGEEYQKYSKDILGVTEKNASKLFVSSVKPGSIDILLQPEFYETAAAGLVIASPTGPVDAVKAIFQFAERIKSLIDVFQEKPDPESVSRSDCSNAINIANNVVETGGSQTINVFNIKGDVSPVLHIDEPKARKVIKNANFTKAQLELPNQDRYNSQALVWKTFDKSPAKVDGQRSPDKGVIQDIDPKPKPVFFDDGVQYLKDEILSSDENLMQMIYFVDVDVVRVDQKIRAYRIVNFHSKVPLDEDG